jgi:integrase
MIRVLVKKPGDRNNYQLYYTNPLTGLIETKSAKTSVKSEADRAAARWETELRDGVSPLKTGWSAFRTRFESEHLVALSMKSQRAYATAMNWFEELVGKPDDLSAITASIVSQFRANLRKKVASEQSVATYLAHLRSALRWGASVGMLRFSPTIKIPRQTKRRFARGRPITEDEFKKLLEVTPEVVGEKDAPEWKRFLRGLWFSGMRLEEAMRLDWTLPPVLVDLDNGKFPRVIWYGEGQKSDKDEAVPMTPDFAAFLSTTPKQNRSGRVFRLTYPNRTVSLIWASKVISAIGTKAGIVVNELGKHASAHDLRRSFGTRWAMIVRPVTLQALMRHRSIETTLKYYVDLHCDDVGAELWNVKIGESVTRNVTKTKENGSHRGRGKSKRHAKKTRA